MKSVAIIVRGRVQGVGFRYHTLNKANELNIQGFVKNQPDGTVYIEAEAREENLGVFIDWCRIGPGRASVVSLDVKLIEPCYYKGFIVK